MKKTILFIAIILAIIIFTGQTGRILNNTSPTNDVPDKTPTGMSAGL